MPWIEVWLIAAALLTAVVSGVAGIGGGTILIAVMLASGLEPVLAVPLHAAVQLASNGSRALAYAPDVRAPAAVWFTLVAVPAAFVVAPLVARMPADAVRLAMAALVLYALLPRVRIGQRLPWRRAMALAGGITGGIGAVVGATGLLISPLFLRDGWSSRSTVGTLALCQALGHLAKVVAFAAAGFAVTERPGLLLGMALGVVVGTAVGRVLHGRLSDRAFRIGFRAILAALGAYLAVSAAAGLITGT